MELLAPDNALWGKDFTFAAGLAEVVKGDLGYPNSFDIGSRYLEFGPYFAYELSLVNVPSIYIYGATFCNNCESLGGIVGRASAPADFTRTFATATAVPEPLTILGSIAATGFLAAFNRIKNKKEE